MFRTLSIAAVIAASLTAAPAFADSVKIDLNGKSSSAIAAEVAKAAAYVCRQAVASPAIPEARRACIQETIAAANAQIAKAYASAPSSTLASN